MYLSDATEQGQIEVSARFAFGHTADHIRPVLDCLLAVKCSLTINIWAKPVCQ